MAEKKKFCEKCGASLGAGDRFCYECGAASPKPPDMSPPRFCDQCGKSLSPEDKFCQECGSPVLGEMTGDGDPG